MHLQDLIGLAQTVPAHNVHIGMSASGNMAFCPLIFEERPLLLSPPHSQTFTHTPQFVFKKAYPNSTANAEASQFIMAMSDMTNGSGATRRSKPRGPRREAGNLFLGVKTMQ
jgi:hypothetical protein